jgi:metallo-beta-lactamase family protein
LLARAGFQGAVYATPASGDMSALILRDSAHIQAQDAERKNRKRDPGGDPVVVPLYTPADAESIIGQFREVPYQRPMGVAPGITATFAEAGHMLGSASIQLTVTEDGREKRVVFSGDLGPKGAPILRDFEPFHRADLVLLESTYGDRDHRPFAETVNEFVKILQAVIAERGKILIPTFAVGRAQMLTMLLSWMFRTGLVKPFPVFLDSPMAIEASRIYMRHVELFDEEMLEFMKERPVMDDLRTLKATPTADESKAINDIAGPCLVMAGAGMCTGGRILHHLHNNLGNPATHVVIVGYQAAGSLGRALVDGVKEVRINGDRVPVRARIHTLGGFSAHAGQKDLLAWLDALAASKPRVALTHGEDNPRLALAAMVQGRQGLTPTLPGLGEVIEL